MSILALAQSRFVRFAGVGVVGLVVDLSVLSLALLAGFNPLAARAVSFLCAVTFTWYANRRLTFQSSHPQWGREWGRFLVANAAGGGVNFTVYGLFIWLTAWPFTPQLGVALGSAAGLMINYIGSKLWAFRPRSAQE